MTLRRVACQLTIELPEELLEAAAERIAELATERMRAAAGDSPWLDFDGAMVHLGFTRDRLYKLTAARAIPFRTKRDGQRLLFHRGELDRWVEAEYESTGCAA